LISRLHESHDLEFEEVRLGLARAGGNHLVDLSDVGHLNPAPGFGEWPAAERLAAKLVVELSFK
jgi:predicted alpha/beta hydrolase family esterase